MWLGISWLLAFGFRGGLTRPESHNGTEARRKESNHKDTKSTKVKIR